MNIVTHRFRGFSERENSYSGFKNALESGVKYFEFDVRLTSDSVPVINHDRYIETASGRKIDIVTSSFDQIMRSVGNHSIVERIMSLAEALDLFKSKMKNDSKIFVDIKDFVEEKQLLNEIKLRTLEENVVIVSWLPEVLFATHSLEPELPLCFSHNFIRSKFQFKTMERISNSNSLKNMTSDLASVIRPGFAEELKNIKFFFDEYNERENQPARDSSDKRDFEHTLSGPVKGRLLEIIENSRGFVCIQFRMLGEGYAGLYDQPPGVIPYSLNNWESLKYLPGNLDYPFILSDNPEMVSKY